MTPPAKPENPADIWRMKRGNALIQSLKPDDLFNTDHVASCVRIRDTIMYQLQLPDDSLVITIGRTKRNIKGEVNQCDI